MDKNIRKIKNHCSRGKIAFRTIWKWLFCLSRQNTGGVFPLFGLELGLALGLGLGLGLEFGIGFGLGLGLGLVWHLRQNSH